MADIRITPGSSIIAFTSSLNYKETLTQDASGSLTVYGSGSTNRTEIFNVDGNNGRLFSVSDDLSDSLFSVNTIAGFPVIEAFADNTVKLGKYGAESIVISGSNGGAIQLSGSIRAISLPSTSDTTVVTFNTTTKTLGYNTVAGPQGAQGSAGSNGAQGATGAQGNNGSNGAQGSAGSNGAQGAAGAQGSAGSNGAQGAAGSNGAQGAAGSNGSNGAQGAAGSNGAQGAAGAQGSAGSNGAQGAAGSNGSNGAQGAAGSNGAQGAAGSNGSNGAQGAAGSNGAQGAAGSNGSNGAQGAAGSNGSNGAQGAAGSNGAQGAAGSTGAQGSAGSNGAQGAQGASGGGGGGTINSSTAGYMAYYSATTTIDGTNKFIFDGANVRFGVNNPSPSYTLDVGGDIYASGNVIAYSDESVKDNVTTITNALDKVKQMRGVTFTRNDEDNKERIYAGVIAQEMEKAFPEVVFQNENGTKAVAYSNLVSVLIEAIKEQQNQIDELKAKLG